MKYLVKFQPGVVVSDNGKPTVDFKWLVPLILAAVAHFGYFVYWTGQVTTEIQSIKQQNVQQQEQMLRRLERMEQFFMRQP